MWWKKGDGRKDEGTGWCIKEGDRRQRTGQAGTRVSLERNEGEGEREGRGKREGEERGKTRREIRMGVEGGR
jgi:hypothetical protein